MVIDNVAGAGGTLGSERVAKGPRDGYSLVLGTVGTHAINPALYASVGYDPLRDFTPIGFVGYTPMLVVAAPDIPANNIRELIALAKTKPGKITFASAGNGTANHLSGELLKVMSGADMLHVPYKNGTQALTDVMGGQVAIMFYHIPAVMQHIKAGKLKALGIASIRRSPAMPKRGADCVSRWLPRLRHEPLVGALRSCRYACGGARQAARHIPGSLYQQPEFVALLAAQGMEGRPMAPDELNAFLRSELPKWAKLVKDSGARID